MIIGLDIDGVLVSFQPGWVRPYNEWFDARVDPREAVTWDSFIELTHFHEEDDFWAWTDTVPNFWQDLSPVPGAMNGVAALAKAKHALVLITNRHANTAMQTTEWVRRHWPLLMGPSPVICHTKHKGDIPCQLYVDDSPKVIKHLKDRGLPVIKFKQPWNKDVHGSAGDVSDWSELVPRIAELAEAIA